MQATTFLLSKMFSKPCIVVKAFKMRKLLVFPSTLAKQHYHHVPQFQRSVNTTDLSFIMTTWSCGDTLVLDRGKDGTAQILSLCHLAVQLLVSQKVQACQRRDDRTLWFILLYWARMCGFLQRCKSNRDAYDIWST